VDGFRDRDQADNPEWFRLFVGDLSNDVNERTLDAAFGKYASYCKCKVVRDRLSEKVRLV
jgi:RNA recognition motif-containing protein